MTCAGVKILTGGLLATALLAGPAAATTGPVSAAGATGTTSGVFRDGPLATKIVAPAAAPACDARYLQVGVRFTEGSDALLVRSVRVALLNPDGRRGRGDSESFARFRGRQQLGRLHPRSCGRDYLVRYRVNAASGSVTWTFRIHIGS